MKFDVICAEKELFCCGLFLAFSVGAEEEYTAFVGIIAKVPPSGVVNNNIQLFLKTILCVGYERGVIG
jgi:hypothetical protein